MGMKNLWSLNVDELLAADELKNHKQSGQEVFIPLNSQLKGIDLALVDLKNGKTIQIQVKGSRTYVPYPAERRRYGNGGSTWFILSTKEVREPENRVDFYIFVAHSLVDAEQKKQIATDYIVVPMSDLKALCWNKKTRKNGTQLHFFLWIDSKEKRAFDIEGGHAHTIDFAKYLNNWLPLVGK